MEFQGLTNWTSFLLASFRSFKFQAVISYVGGWWWWPFPRRSSDSAVDLKASFSRMNCVRWKSGPEWILLYERLGPHEWNSLTPNSFRVTLSLTLPKPPHHRKPIKWLLINIHGCKSDPLSLWFLTEKLRCLCTFPVTRHVSTICASGTINYMGITQV